MSFIYTLQYMSQCIVAKVAADKARQLVDLLIVWR